MYSFQYRGFGLAVFIVLLLVSLQSTGCSRSSRAAHDVAFACDSDPKPPRIGLNTFTVVLSGSNNEQLTGAHISLEGDMSHPGMSPVFGEASEIAPGQYRGTLDLNMLGDWTIVFHITLATGQSLDRQVQLQHIRAT
jgi:YtkA-like protein